ncbi:MAG: hypothetical protein HZA49_04990 [Planctomycetes bacterium]|nr:hypothetical protein [Planctomycetota bacterium]
MKNFVLIAALLVLVALLSGIIGYRYRTNPINQPDLAATPDSIASGRYPEFLREILEPHVEVEGKTAWIWLINKSEKERIPDEESHRAIVCTTDLINTDGQIMETYKEYFKRPAPNFTEISQQINPKTSAEFGYDLTFPHGKVRIKITYEDFSVTDENKEAGKIFLAEKEASF